MMLKNKTKNSTKKNRSTSVVVIMIIIIIIIRTKRDYGKLTETSVICTFIMILTSRTNKKKIVKTGELPNEMH
jgi:cell division protein FtsW (lipid II flippase)